MIRYTLNCASGHRFESWFPSSASFDAQRARGLVTCPSCGSAEVEKAVMAPSVARTDRTDRPPVPMAEPAASADAPVPAAAPAASASHGAGLHQAGPHQAGPLAPRPDSELRALLRQLRNEIVNSSDYVGDEFANLARKMHEGEIEHRSIYGEATEEEVKALREDEVEVLPLPILPEDRN